MFAGRQITRVDYITDEFTELMGFDKNVDYEVPNPARGGFMLLAKCDAAGFPGDGRTRRRGIRHRAVHGAARGRHHGRHS